MLLIKSIISLVFFILFIPIIVAQTGHGHEEFEQAEAIINAGIPCESLTEGELEIIGDYYMEQMHPGKEHEIMDERMGGEGSESLRLMHIQMARNFYCYKLEADTKPTDENTFGMMGNNLGFGMMGFFPWFGIGFFGWVFMILIITVLILLIIWLIKQIQT